MTNPNEQIAAWNQAAYDAATSYARASLLAAEQLLRLNLETTRASLDQAAKATRELMGVHDPQELLAVRTRLAQLNMQHAATYAHSVYEIVSQTQQDLARLFEEQIQRATGDLRSGAEAFARTAPGGELQAAALTSTLAATSTVMDSLNQAVRQFAEMSEASIKAATANMVRGVDRR